MKVTNEQAIDLSKCNGTCKTCKTKDLCCDLSAEEVCSLVAQDLLEARETIEKQEEIIKEMREVLSSNLRDMVNIDQVCAMAGVHPYTIMRSEISAILDKSKEYAE